MNTPTFTAEASLFRSTPYRVVSGRGPDRIRRLAGKLELAGDCWSAYGGSCPSYAYCADSRYVCTEEYFPCATNPDGTVAWCRTERCDLVCYTCCRWGYEA